MVCYCEGGLADSWGLTYHQRYTYTHPHQTRLGAEPQKPTLNRSVPRGETPARESLGPTHTPHTTVSASLL